MRKAVAFAGNYDDENVARLARVIQIHGDKFKLDNSTPAFAVPRKIQAALEKYGAELDTTFSVENLQKLMGQAAAGSQVHQQGGTTLDLREVISRRARPGANIDFLVQLAQRFGGLESLEHYAKNLELAQSGTSPMMHVGMRIGQALSGLGVIDDPRLQATPEDLAVLRGAFTEINKRSRPQSSPTPAPQTSPYQGGRPSDFVPMEPHGAQTPTPGQPTVYNIDNRSYNARNYGAFAQGQRSVIENGETRARRIEMV